MKAFVLSFFERVLPRSSLAIVLLLSAALLPAPVVGIYTWITLVYGFTQSAFDAAIRQVAVEALERNPLFLRRYMLVYCLIAPLIILSAIGLLGLDKGPLALSMLPFALAPIANGVATRRLAHLQMKGKWRVLAQGQMFSAVCSLCLTVPLLISTGQIWVAALQVLLSEAFNTFWIFRNSPRNTGVMFEHPDKQPLIKIYIASAAYTLLGWGQSQGDRLLVGFFAGTTTLANYNFTNSISRTGGAALGASGANVLRTKLVKSDPSKHRGIVERATFQSVFIATVIAAVATLASKFILPLFLDRSWDDALRIIPILAGASIFTVISFMVSAVLVVHRRIRGGILANLLGIVLAIPVAVVAAHSLEMAALLAWVRELVSLVLVVVFSGAHGPRKATLCALPISLAFIIPSLNAFF